MLLKSYTNLNGWSKGTTRKMPFCTPMVWMEPTNHTEDCYFCLTQLKGFSEKSKRSIKYTDVASVITLNNIEKQAWNAFIDITKKFLGKKKTDDFREKIKVLLD